MILYNHKIINKQIPYQLLIDNTKKDGGVTFDIINNSIVKPKDHWLFPKFPSKTLILKSDVGINIEVKSFIENNLVYLSDQDTYFGLWINPKTQDYYLDIITAMEDENKAMEKARELSKKERRQIVSIYNPDKNETIYL